jgi:hypothetical protein
LKQTTTSVIHYKGRITFERIGMLLNDLKTRKESYRIQPVVYKKLLTLMIEVLENIFKYSDHFEEFTRDQPEYLPEFELKIDKDDFLLIARNPVRRSDTDRIRSRIHTINNSTEEHLKKIYRETITNGVFTEKGGAGLGFIEMAKIASRELDFNFSPASGDYLIYELIIHTTNTEHHNHE